MGNYDTLIESYELFLEKKRENLDKEGRKSLEVQINAMKAVNDKTQEEICAIFNTGAFNNIVKGFCHKAMENCTLDDSQIEEIMEELNFLFDTISAMDVL